MRLFALYIFYLIFVSCNTDTSTQEAEYFDLEVSTEEIVRKGEVLFSANCKACHSLDANSPTSLAPVLDSISYHWPESYDLARYIKNAPSMQQFNDHTRFVHRIWKNKSQMPPFMGLQMEEINCITRYLYKNTH